MRKDEEKKNKIENNILKKKFLFNILKVGTDLLSSVYSVI